VDEYDSFFGGQPEKPETAGNGFSADPYDAFFSSAAQTAGRTKAVGNRGVNGDQAARAANLAKAEGLPFETAQRQLPDVEERVLQRQVAGAVKADPKLGTFLGAGHNAAIARDDVGILSKAGGIFADIGSALGSALPAANQGVYGLLTAIAEAQNPISAALDALGAPGGEAVAQARAPVVEWLTQARQQSARLAQEMTPETESDIARGLYSGVQSLPMSVAALGASIVGGPGLGLAMFGGITGGGAYGEARDEGLSPRGAAVYGATQGMVEAGSENISLPFLVAGMGKMAATRFMGELLGREMLGEQVATHVQDFNEWRILHPEKTLQDYVESRPEAAAQTALATAVTVGTFGTLNAGLRLAERRRQARQAQDEQARVDSLLALSDQSKLKQRDPEALRQFLGMHAEGTPAEKLYIPADALASYFQSAGMDWHSDGHDFAWSEDFASQMDDALASGGDVVVDTAGFAAHAGPELWAAIREEARLSPGGMSPAEARTFEEAKADEFARMSDEMLSEMETARATQAPQREVYEQVREQLTAAGYAPDQAQRYAELMAERYATRGARLGEDALSAFQRSGVEVRQVLPERLANVVAADSLDIVVAATRGKRDENEARTRGPSLLAFIASRGGVEDPGGDLASMGATEWHRMRPFRRQLLRMPPGELGGISGPAPASRNSLDATTLAAWEAGYFPDRAERPSINDLLDAAGRELRGEPVYAPRNLDTTSEAQDAIIAAADELRAILENAGLDPATATDADIRRVTETFRLGSDGQELGQSEINRGGRDVPVQRNAEVALNTVPITALDGKTFERAKEAVAALKGQETALASGERVTFTQSDKVLRFAGPEYSNPMRHAVAANLRQVVEAAVSYGDAAHSTGAPGGFTYAVARVSLAGRPMTVRLTLRAPGDGKLRQYQVEGFEVAAGPDVPTPAGAPREVVAGTNAGGDPTVIGVVADFKGRRLFQSFADDQRARITFTPDGRSIIELFESRDASSFIHEAGHLFLEELKVDAALEGVDLQVAADWQAVQKWFADNGHPIGEDGVIPVEAHEMWAHGFERFAMEGKAPSTALRRAFETFKAWLLGIYKRVENLRAPITPEIRDVMARLLATDEAIAEAQQRQNIKALFTSAAEAGMSEAAFAEYQRAASDARDEAHDALLYRTMAAVRARRTQEWKDAEAPIRDKVTASADGRPEFRALKLLRRRGGVRLERGWLVERYGEDALKLLPSGLYLKEGGTDADAVAEMAGFHTGDEMVRALMGLQTRQHELRDAGDKRTVRQRLIDDEVSAVMNERYGDVLADGSIEQEALAAVHNERQGEVIAAELRSLARRYDKRLPTAYSVAREWAREKVRTGTVNDVLSKSAIQRYAREAAILAGDGDEAYRQKQRQMLNNALVAEAGRMADEVDAAVKRLARYSKPDGGPKTIAIEYRDRIEELLERFDFKRRTQRDLAERESFSDWARAQAEAGYEVHYPPRLANAEARNWQRMTAEELIALDDSVKSLAALGRQLKKLRDGKDERDLEDVVDDAVGGAAGIPDRRSSGMRNPKRRLSSEAAAWLLKIEAIADELDAGNHNGAFNRQMVWKATDAANELDRLRERVLKPIGEAYAGMTAQQRRRLHEKVVLPEFGGDTFTRFEVLAIALNTGNASNLEKLVAGESKARGVNLTPETVNAVLDRELTADDWRLVQLLWDQVDSLWPDIVRVERDLSGVEPERVQASSITNRHGTFRGGYWPVVYDPLRSTMGQDNADETAKSLLGGIGRTVATAKGHTITRTRAAAPLLLSVEGVLFDHVEKVATRIAYGPFIRDAMRFLKHPKIRQIIVDKFGIEYYDQFKPWLQRQVREGILDTRGMAAAERFARRTRASVSLVAMGLRVSTGVAQVAGLSSARAFVGSRYLARGMQRMVAGGMEGARFALERSEELQRRNEAVNRDIADFFRDAAGKSSPLDRIRAFGFWHIGMIDRYVVAVPTWLGAYEQSLDRSESEEEAARYADKAVRMSQGSGRAKDLAAVQAPTSEFVKWFTMFYSYFNVQMNAQWRAKQMTRRGDWRKAMSMSFWFLVAAPLIGAALTGDLPDEDEDPASWAGRNIFFNFWAGLPLVRDVTSYASRKIGGEYADYSATPVARAVESAEKLGNDLIDLVRGDDISDAWVKHAVETPGYFLALPTGQLANTTQGLVNLVSGEEDPEGISDWYEGLTRGRIDDEE
jgi:hypothetical protein